MKYRAREHAAEVNEAELFCGVFRRVEGRCLFRVKWLNFAASESSERFTPPKLSLLTQDACYQEMAVIAATDPSKLFRKKPTDLFSAYCSLNISKPFFYSGHREITHGNLFERNRHKPIPLRET